MTGKQAGNYDLWLNESMEDARLASSPATHRPQQVYAHGGYRAVMEELAKPGGSNKLARNQDIRVDACLSAEANVVLDRNSAALNALDNYYRVAKPALLYLKVDPSWTKLRFEPRSQNLLHRLGLQ
jgi:hypothetical protein